MEGTGLARKPVPAIRRRPVPGAPEYNHQADIYDIYRDESSPSQSIVPSQTAGIQQLKYSKSIASLAQKPAAPHASVTRPATAISCQEISTEAFSAQISITAPEDDLPPPPPYPGLSVPSAPALPLRHSQSSAALSIGSSSSPDIPPRPPHAVTLPVDVGTDTKQQDSFWQSAIGNAQYFASGIIAHPCESTRHYSIIRHTSALIWYSGPSTSVSVSVLSDEPLPPTRTLWMQQKGFSGNMGMAIKAFAGTTGSWINVTPARQTAVSDTPEADERIIQRDFKRFVKKASSKQKKHIPRETHVVRIPATASDGYFRLVLCAGAEPGKKILCGSPVFRVASTSTDVSVMRGASLSTMPLEMGVKVASTIGQAMANRYIGVASTVVNSQVSNIVTNQTIKKAGTMAYQSYQVTGMGDTVQESWQRQRDQQERYDSLVENVPIIGSEAGPESPFPVKFDGKVVPGTGRSYSDLGIPSANLSGVSDQIRLRMPGVFAAWACIHIPPNNTNNGKAPGDAIPTDWFETIVTIAPSRHAPPSVAMENSITVHIIHDFQGANLVGAKVKVLLMGYLHAAAHHNAPLELLVDQHFKDVDKTLASLSRIAWGPHDTMSMLKTVKSNRTFAEKMDDTTGKVVRQVDKIPLHRVGMRSDVGLMQDKAYGNGGLWIVR
ncbi:riboflavin kinase [Trichoderma asperellum]|uniref:Riboflavin kinase n=1 Tax=Trichoderma asperellum TaxID=101201 RepID=A0A6V8QHX3_TRIAP|nr:hypothetical protein LI328DRAFT_135340 [Trichoderma asperelloides]GFP51889.1 riboflavin kinase [Trichoderma asperellum]